MPRTVIYADNEPVFRDDGSKRGRVLAPKDRMGGVIAFVPGGDVPFLEFTSQFGDVTSEDAGQYKPGSAPTRSLIAFEEDGNLRRFGVPVEFSTEVMFPSAMPDGTWIPMTSENLFHVVVQWNAWKDKKELKRSPPIEIDLRAGDIPTMANGRETVEKDAAGKPIHVERFVFMGRYLTEPSTTDKSTTIELAKSDAIVRDRFYELQVRFVDNRGRDGELAIWLDGKQYVDYRGPLFYAAEGQGYGGGYLGFGNYRHNGIKTPFASRFRALREGAVKD